MSGVGTLCARVRLLVDRQSNSSSVGFQPTKNLLSIMRISCPRFWFWTDILRPLVSFPSLSQEVGILCVCLCLVVFLSSLVLYRADVLVHSLCMIRKDAWLFVRFRTNTYRFLSGSFRSVLASLRMVHVPLGSEPFQALDRGPPFFCCEGLDIFHVSIGLFLSRAICHSMCHLGTLPVFFPVISRHVC